MTVFDGCEMGTLLVVFAIDGLYLELGLTFDDKMGAGAGVMASWPSQRDTHQQGVISSSLPTSQHSAPFDLVLFACQARGCLLLPDGSCLSGQTCSSR